MKDEGEGSSGTKSGLGGSLGCLPRLPLVEVSRKALPRAGCLVAESVTIRCQEWAQGPLTRQC